MKAIALAIDGLGAFEALDYCEGLLADGRYRAPKMVKEITDQRDKLRREIEEWARISTRGQTFGR